MKTIKALSLATLLACLPAVALAHTGSDAGSHHASSFLQGFSHPFSGIDHLLAMLVVGLWSASTTQSGQRLWLAPLSFAAVLLVGGLLGAAGLNLAGVEPMIAVSVLMLGLLLASKAQLAPWLTATLVSIFALFHGLAHGAELSSIQALAGMVLASACLHIAGLAIGQKVLSQRIWLARIIGASVAASGLALLANTL